MKFLVTWEEDRGYFCGERTWFESEFFETQKEAEDFAQKLQFQRPDDPFHPEGAYNIEVFKCEKI